MNFDSSEWRAERDRQLAVWMAGNQSAVEFLQTLFAAAELWDDLHDGDSARAAASADQVMLSLLLDLPHNPFFDAHRHELRAVMLAGVNAWMDSAELEKLDDPWSRTWAYALRDWYMELVPLCAWLVGGFQHMRDVSLAARRFFQAETLQEYLDGYSD